MRPSMTSYSPSGSARSIQTASRSGIHVAMSGLHLSRIGSVSVMSARCRGRVESLSARPFELPAGSHDHLLQDDDCGDFLRHWLLVTVAGDFIAREARRASNRAISSFIWLIMLLSDRNVSSWIWAFFSELSLTFWYRNSSERSFSRVTSASRSSLSSMIRPRSYLWD
jgi:hypothetical protein